MWNLLEKDLIVLNFSVKKHFKVTNSHLKFRKIIYELCFGFYVGVRIKILVIHLLIILFSPLILVLVELFNEFLVNEQIFVSVFKSIVHNEIYKSINVIMLFIDEHIKNDLKTYNVFYLPFILLKFIGFLRATLIFMTSLLITCIGIKTLDEYILI